ncbi:MAG: dockerin type I domain-containing protein [Phycisphaeraceae bacterium]
MRSLVTKLTVVALTLAMTNLARADGVSLGGLMNHINVGVSTPINGSFPLTITLDADPGEGLEMILGEPPLPEPYDVLEDRAYNAQYGWLRQGRWGPGSGEAAFIEVIDVTPGLSIYEGAYASDSGGGVSDGLNGEHTLNPIFGTDGAPNVWPWDGRMTHHWNVSDAPGTYEATFRVFVAENLNGLPGDLSPTFLPGEITLTWIDTVSTPSYNVDDINQLAEDLRLATTTPDQDYDQSGTVDDDDRLYLIQTLIGTVLGDANLDLRVDLIDLSALAASFSTSPDALWQHGDVSGDGSVDLIDLSMLATNFGSDLTQVPEPVSVLSLFALTLRRRHRS